MLHVEGIEPGRIKCVDHGDGQMRVRLDNGTIATLDARGPTFDGVWYGSFREIRFFCRDCVLFYIPTELAFDGRGNPVP